MERLERWVLRKVGLTPRLSTFTETALSPRTGEARQFVQHLVDGHFEEAAACFAPRMRRALGVPELRQVWEKLAVRMGTFQRVTGMNWQRLEGRDVVFVTLQLELKALLVKVVYNGEGVCGLWFSEPPRALPYQPPAYADRIRFREADVSFGEGRWVLPGTLSLPISAHPVPAIVLVHGSGPNDRDETLGPNRPFRDLAWGLATQGIAVLRYDKRTLVHAHEMASLACLTVADEVVDDAVAAVAWLRGRDDIDPARVFVLGHSLGGTLSPRIAARAPGVAGLVVLAGATRSFGTLLLEQSRYLSTLEGAASDESKAALASLEAEVARLDSPALSASDPPVLGVPASYWLDLRNYDPVAEAAQLTQPILVAQGGRDYQVTELDFARWQAGLASRPRASLRRYPDANHLFMSGTGKPTPAEYERAGHVAPEVIADVAAWLRAV